MIKGKPSYPFETIALAVDFGPYLEAMIASVKQLADAFGAKTIFIHPDKRIVQKDQQLTQILNKYNFSDADSKIIWNSANSVDAILAACKDEVVDLLIIKGVEQENQSDYFTGSVLKELVPKAKSSILLIAEPQAHADPYRRIVVNGHNHPKTIHTIETAIYFASGQQAQEITIADRVAIPQLDRRSIADVDVLIEPDMETSEEEILQDEISRINGELMQVDHKGLRIKVRTFSARHGTTGHFARIMGADLLVVNSSDHHLAIFDRIPVNNIEGLLTDMPCDTLIVHSRVY